MIFLIYIMLLHWIGDFLFQTEWMANNKSHNLFALTDHALTYMTAFLLGFLFIPSLFFSFAFIHFFLANFAAHWVTDFWTSKLTSHKRTRAFFLVLGFDQFVHAATLILTTKFLLGVAG